MGGKRRLMQKHAFILIHQLSSGTLGNFEELKDDIKCCKKLMDMFKVVYNRETKIPERKFKMLMKRDVYLSAEECLEYQIVNEIFCP